VAAAADAAEVDALEPASEPEAKAAVALCAAAFPVAEFDDSAATSEEASGLRIREKKLLFRSLFIYLTSILS
jgi:hypothetical protein